MKELSIEEKARRYDKAIEIAKDINNEQRAQPFNVMTRVFPELKESEDEMIRNFLISKMKEVGNVWKEYSAKDIIAWLEKQGEQPKKHDVCDTCDEKDSCISPCCVKLVEEQGGQKPVGFNIGDEITVNGRVCRVVAVDRSAWSEEDERCLTNAIYACEQMSNEDYEHSQGYIDAIEWLNSLRPYSQWKPSNEQIEALKQAKTDACGKPYFNALASLYVKLKV